MKRIILSVLTCFLALQCVIAQGPKWVSKAKRAVLSVMTFDENNNILKTNNGFYISEDGVAVSDYQLFKGANRALVIDTEGKEYKVISVLGADDTYDVIKFKVGVNKKVDYLEISSDSSSIGSEIFIIPYSVQLDRSCRPGKVKEVDRIRNDHAYYTLDIRATSDLISGPVMNSEGKVIGLLQKSYDESEAMTSHAVDINLVNELSINAFSMNDYALNAVKIKKSLPLQEEQALIYIYLKGENLSDQKYQELLNDFISQFPNSSEGYLKRAQFIAQKNPQDPTIITDFEQAYKLAIEKDEVLYSTARIIADNLVNTADKNTTWTYKKALDKVNEAISIKSAGVYKQLKGDILVAMGNYKEALTVYQNINSSDEATALSLYSEAMMYKLKQESPDKIIQMLDSCINQLEKPYQLTAAPYLLERATVLATNGKYRESLLDLKEYYYAVDGKVDGAFFYFRAQVAEKGKMYQQAIDYLNLAIQESPKETLYWLEYAALNLRVGRYEEVLEVTEVLLNIDSENSDAYRLQGIAYLQLNDDRACQSLHKAKELGDTLVDSLIDKNCK